MAEEQRRERERERERREIQKVDRPKPLGDRDIDKGSTISFDKPLPRDKEK